MADGFDRTRSMTGMVLAPRGATGMRQPWMMTKAIVAAARLSGDLLALLLALWAAPQLADALRGWMGLQTPASDLIPSAATADVVKYALPILGLAALGALACQGHYDRRLPQWTVLRQLLAIAVTGACGSTFLMFALHVQPSRLLVMSVWTLFPAAVLLLRLLVHVLLESAGLWRIPTVILGDREAARAVAAALTSEPGMGYDIVGQVAPVHLHQRQGEPLWRPIMRRFRAHLVIIAPGPDGCWPERTITDALVCENIPFALIPPTCGLPVADCTPTYFLSHDTVLLSYRNNLMKPLAHVMKIAFDLSLAAVLLVLLAPLMLLIAWLIRIDGGPALFGHSRIGAGGRSFRCLKFRSMVSNAGDVLDKLLAEDPAAAAEWRDTQKLRHDPRITRIGAWLRKTSLDELPQLINVLRLEMSLVGPRPIVTAEIPRYGNDIVYYVETRPGVTGLWQVSGRNDTSYAQRVHLDSWYVKNWTLWHDIAILAKTVPAVLHRRGAC